VCGFAIAGKEKFGTVASGSKSEKGDAGSAELELRCQKCGTKLAHPARWHKDCTEDAHAKRANKVSDCKRQGVTSAWFSLQRVRSAKKLSLMGSSRRWLHRASPSLSWRTGTCRNQLVRWR
jgi:hypothetical protein